MLVILIPVTIVHAQTPSQNDTADSEHVVPIRENDCKNDLLNCFVHNWGAIIIALITLIGSFFGTSLITQKYRIRNIHLLPYVQWCVGAYGTIHEFKELYDYAKNPTKFQNAPLPAPLHNPTVYGNPIYVITHFWEMHREAEKGYKWIGQIKKENPRAYLAFNKLFDDVDKLWHYLENTYSPYLVGPQNNVDSFRNLLKRIPGSTRDAIKNDIINTINDNQFGLINDKRDYNIPDYAIETVMIFLQKKIPKKSYFKIDI